MPSLFLQLAENVLREEKRPMSANEIWELAVVKGYDKAVATTGKTPWSTLSAMLYVDIRDNSQSMFESRDTHPKSFLLKNLIEGRGVQTMSEQAYPQKPRAAIQQTGININVIEPLSFIQNNGFIANTNRFYAASQPSVDNLSTLLKTIKEYREYADPSSPSKWKEYIKEILTLFEFDVRVR